MGAFEIQIASRSTEGYLVKNVVHSKLKTKEWPSMAAVLNSIAQYQPKCNL